MEMNYVPFRTARFVPSILRVLVLSLRSILSPLKLLLCESKKKNYSLLLAFLTSLFLFSLLSFVHVRSLGLLVRVWYGGDIPFLIFFHIFCFVGMGCSWKELNQISSQG